MNLSDEEKAIGQDNFRRVTGQLLDTNESRRDFLKEVTLAGAVTAGARGKVRALAGQHRGTP